MWGKTLRRMVVAVGVLALFAQLAGATTSTGAPFAVQAASLVQDGRDLVWTVQLNRPFSPARLVREHHALCLVVERARSSAVVGDVCVHGPSRGTRTPRLVVRFAGGTREAVPAMVTRGSARELTARLDPADIGLRYRPIRWQVVSPAVFPARPALLRVHQPILVGCSASGPAFVYHGSPARRVIALTFDDGPWPDTPQFLSVLEREHVPATFFQIGRQISTYGRTVDRRMLADGDMIGDHTWSHADVAGDGPFAASQISMAADAIRSVTGFRPCLFRAPGGAVSPALIAEARRMGFTTIQWDIDPRDWALPGTNAIVANVVSHAHNGAIVIQHDGGGNRSETLAALPREIAALRGEGYGFVTVTDLLGLRLIYK